MNALLAVFASGASCGMAVFFAGRIYKERRVGRIVFALTCLLGVTAASLLNFIQHETAAFDLVTASLVIIPVSFLYREKLHVKLLFGLFFVTMATFSQTFSTIFISTLLDTDISGLSGWIWSFAGIVVVAFGVFFALCYLFSRFQRNRKDDIPGGLSFLLLTIPLCSTVIAIFVFYLYLVFPQQTNTERTMELVVLLGILFINFMVFWLFDKVAGLLRQSREKQVLEQQLAMQAAHFGRLEEHQKEVRGLRHDMKSKLQTLYQFIEGGEAQRAGEYLNSMLDSVQAAPRVVETGNPSLDAVLNTKLQEADAAGIAVEVDVLLPAGINLPFERAVALLGNLLDNALEACAEEPEKWIRIKMHAIQDALYLQIVNASLQRPPGLASTKGDTAHHGFGLKRVAYVVEQYGGLLKVEQGPPFAVQVVLHGVLAKHDGETAQT